MADKKEYSGSGQASKFEPGPATISPISLSQALLAPLDAIFKAQIHAARSFLNLILQIGYPHRPIVDSKGNPSAKGGKPYNQEFYYDVEINGEIQRRKVSVPTLALIPVAPLAIESAEFKLAMKVSNVQRHTQMQESEKESLKEEEKTGYGHDKRPWFLVPDPVSIRGTIGPSSDGREESGKESTIQIEVKVGKVPMPAGLDKLLTFLTQTSYAVEGGGDKIEKA